ncbi:ribonuclease H-like domain-containing protein [Tanacetum coccineum]|uniref:Ribonuclease H-like domain-containing protein n=1 Tax=Tanacetum coccineum TaxID=301880 RepID=A0ABQ4XTK4_9ASTR
MKTEVACKRFGLTGAEVRYNSRCCWAGLGDEGAYVSIDMGRMWSYSGWIVDMFNEKSHINPYLRLADWLACLPINLHAPKTRTFGEEMLRFLVSNKMIDCNKTKSTTLCHACQIGKHTRLPFFSSNSRVENLFDIVHSDIWTSPIPPVVKPATIRTVLSLVVSRAWPIHQDVKNAFLHGYFSETVYMHSPPGFGTETAYLFLYVDDIILTASSTRLLQQIISSLHSEFAMTNLGSLNYFLGISAQRTSSGLFLTQTKYATEILKHAMRSTSGYCVFLNDNLISWSSKRQHVISRSSAEAEYHGVTNAVAETAWVRNLLRDLLVPLRSATLVYCDNVSAVYLSSYPVQHQRTKHIEIDIHFVRDFVATGHVRVLHVPSRYKYADIFTKGLLYLLFEEFRSSLSVRPPPAPTVGVY